MIINKKEFIENIILNDELKDLLSLMIPGINQAKESANNISKLLNLRFSEAFQRVYYTVQPKDQELKCSYDIQLILAKLVKIEEDSFGLRFYFIDRAGNKFDLHFNSNSIDFYNIGLEYILVGYYYITPNITRFFTAITINNLPGINIEDGKPNLLTTFIENYISDFNYNLDDIKMRHKQHLTFDINLNSFKSMFNKTVGLSNNLKDSSQDKILYYINNNKLNEAKELLDKYKNLIDNHINKE